MKTNFPTSITRPASRIASLAFSLVEIMVVVALLSVIIFGLLLMFNQTQRAFRTGLAQVDVQEGGRTLVEMIGREVMQMVPTYRERVFSGPNYVVNFTATLPATVPYAPLIQPLPGPPTLPNGDRNERTNLLEDMFFMQKENLRWSGIGYFVRESDGAGNLVFSDTVGALYRFETNYTDLQFKANPGWFTRDYGAAQAREGRANKIVDGVVHFKVKTYDPAGIWQTDNLPNDPLQMKSDIRLCGYKGFPLIAAGEIGYYGYYSNAVPAFVEIELGVLESRIAQRAKAIPDAIARRQYLENQASRVHIFRMRVPVRNVDPQAYQ